MRLKKRCFKKGSIMENVKVRKKIFDILLNVFAWLSFFVAVILAFAVLFSTFSGTENGKVVFGHKLLIVESDSMRKSEKSENESIFFNSGDLIIIKEVSDYSDVKVGDVISFISHNPDSVGKTLSHKVRSIKTNANGALIGFETYGIYTGVSDFAVVEPSTVIGKYVGKVPNLGDLFSFFKKPAGYFTAVLIPCLLLIIYFSVTVGKQIGRKSIIDGYDDEIDTLKGRITQLENDGVNVKNSLEEMNSTNEAALATEQTETVAEEPAAKEEVNKTEPQAQPTYAQAQNPCPSYTCAPQYAAPQYAPQYAAPQYAPPQYAPQYAQPQYAQPQYAQVQYAQPQYAPPQYAQPQYVTHKEAEVPSCIDKTIELSVKSLTNTIDVLTHTIESLALSVEKPVERLVHTVEVLASASSKPTVIENHIINPVKETVVKEELKPSSPVVETAAPAPAVANVAPVVEEAPVAAEAPVVKEAPVAAEAPAVKAASVAELSASEPSLVVEAFEPEESEAEEARGFSLDDLQSKEKLPFNKKLLSLDSEIKNYFSEVHNELVSHKKVKYRISFKGITYRIGRNTLAKMMVRGKTLKLHLALNVEDYPKTVFFQEDSSDVKMYSEVPFTVKIKSNRGKNNAIKLISYLAENNGLVKNEEFKTENVLKQLKAIK